MDVDEVYQYSELTGTDAIRLIYLQPCEDLEAGVECSLKDASLIEYGEDIGDHYIAISYVWGNPDDTRSILVDGKRLDITASLDSALRHVRDGQRVLRVWADGVCIDQKDVHDRNRQVRLMGDVYSTAQHTVIFLGTSSPECDAVFQLMSCAPQFSGQGEQRSDVPELNSSRRLNGYERIVEDEILARPWFTRVWILQELVLSQNPWLQCGRHRVRWHVFCRWVLSSPPDFWKPDSRAILKNMNDNRAKCRPARDEIRPKSEAFPGKTLLELLRSRRGCGLSDPRDMVYAHLGLASFETRKTIPIDYDKSITQVYQDIAISYMNGSGLRFVLSLVDHIQPEKRPSHLPSWITDWSTSCPAEAQSFNGPNVQPEMVPYINCSWAVPGVLAVIGYDCGSVNRTMLQSSWPECGDNGEYTTAKDVLQWLSGSDDAAVVSKQLLADLAVKQRLDRHPDYALLDFFDDPAWARVISIVRLLDPERLNMQETHVKYFVNAYISVLIDLSQSYDKFYHMAVLDSGAVVRMPNLARPGDVLVASSDPHMRVSTRRPFYMILRPQNAFLPLSRSEEGRIRDDLCNKRPQRFERDARKLHQGYTFVATTSTSMSYWYYHGKMVVTVSGPTKLFALR